MISFTLNRTSGLRRVLHQTRFFVLYFPWSVPIKNLMLLGQFVYTPERAFVQHAFCLPKCGLPEYLYNPAPHKNENRCRECTAHETAAKYSNLCDPLRFWLTVIRHRLRSHPHFRCTIRHCLIANSLVLWLAGKLG